jgi:hypothetical protein
VRFEKNRRTETLERLSRGSVKRPVGPDHVICKNYGDPKLKG